MAFFIPRNLRLDKLSFYTNYCFLRLLLYQFNLFPLHLWLVQIITEKKEKEKKGQMWVRFHSFEMWRAQDRWINAFKRNGFGELLKQFLLKMKGVWSAKITDLAHQCCFPTKQLQRSVEKVSDSFVLAYYIHFGFPSLVLFLP